MKAAVIGYLGKQNPLMLAGGAALLIGVAYFLARKTVKDTVNLGAGLVSGNNAITQHQTNAAGEKTAAYQGAGVVGTIGAATNSASGGVFASIGESIGGWLYDATHSDPLADAQAKYQKPPATTNSQAGELGGPVPLSYYGGASFKDLGDPLSVNPFRSLDPTPLGQVVL